MMADIPVAVPVNNDDRVGIAAAQPNPAHSHSSTTTRPSKEDTMGQRTATMAQSRCRRMARRRWSLGGALSCAKRSVCCRCAA